jgi:hypothetical protein
VGRVSRRLRSVVALGAAATITATAMTYAAPPPSRAAVAVVGVNDSLSTRHDRTRTVAAPGVLASDLNLLGSTTASLAQNVSHGTLTLRSDGGYTYTPAPGFVGSDFFRYLPSGLLSTGARVNITVTNAAPVARNDAYSTPGRTTLVVPAPGVLANDTDADGDALVAELDGGGVSGSLDIDSNGALRFSPGGGFSGSATVTYRVWDGVVWSSASVTLTSAPAAPTPVPTPQPTPKPTPQPSPIVPLPSLPPPSAPLPSLRLPLLPPLLPGDGASPPITDPRPSSSADPAAAEPRRSPGSQSSRAPAAAPSGSAAPSGAAAPGRAPAQAGGADDDRGTDARIQPAVAFEPEGSEFGVGTLDLALGIGIYAVPAAILVGPGVLLLLWVALQTIGTLAWVPAVRRLRGRDEMPLGPTR